MFFSNGIIFALVMGVMKGYKKEGSRAIKKNLRTVFSGNLDDLFEKIESYPVDSIIGPVISFFYHKDPFIKFRAITLIGKIISELFENKTEKARVVMRRLMWNLNDESGGIGWGSAEAMGEAMMQNRGVAKEFGNMLISYINMEGNYLEHPELQKGALWAIFRSGEVNKVQFTEAKKYLPDFYKSNDSETRGLALLASIELECEFDPLVKYFNKDEGVFEVFIGDEFVRYVIKDIVNQKTKTKTIK